MMTLEVFSKKAPFEDIADDRDVWKAVLRGRLPAKPEGCPAAVYDKLMLASWGSDPHSRPKFADLREMIAKLGGDSTEDHREGGGRSTEWDRLQRVHSPAYFKTTEGRKFLGISVNHLLETLYPAVVAACHAPYTRGDGSSIEPKDARIFDAVNAYCKPRTAEMICPTDGQKGTSYVDSLTHVDDVGPASALLSYSWRYKVGDVVQTLAAWARKNSRNLKKTRVWVCSLCLNQHRINDPVSPAELGRTFGERVERIGRIAPMLDTWKGTGYVSRAWCLFELFTAIQNRDVAIDIVLPPDQRALFLQAIKKGGYGSVDKIMASIKSEEATATIEADLIAIKSMVEELPGEYATLDRTVRAHLQSWFEENGMVASASRIMGNKSTASNMLTSSAITWTKTTDVDPTSDTEATAGDTDTADPTPEPTPAASRQPVEKARSARDPTVEVSDEDSKSNSEAGANDYSRPADIGSLPPLPPRDGTRAAIYTDNDDREGWWDEVSTELKLSLRASAKLGRDEENAAGDASSWNNAGGEFEFAVNPTHPRGSDDPSLLENILVADPHPLGVNAGQVPAASSIGLRDYRGGSDVATPSTHFQPTHFLG